MRNIKSITSFVISLLEEGLSPKLTYHNLQHTLDVRDQCIIIARKEGIKSVHALKQLETAAMLHDTGFLYTYKDHEEKGCDIAKQELPKFGATGKEIEEICSLIMATKLPHDPQNLLEEIICDADLDYLGRDDFETISDDLRKEFLEFGIVKTNEEWHHKQIQFFETHRYFTKTSIKRRDPLKQKHLLKLKAG
ncbi:MAG: HD domain-containing protein [Chitinophagaceae bacterium]|nr:HD domain-containing protein [Chitinophagaceae bacterium]